MKQTKNQVNQTGLKVCLVASAGGHLTQLMQLRNAWQGCDLAFVTTTEVMRTKLSMQGRVYIAGESNRSHPFRLLKTLFLCARAILRERPDVLVSSGAASGCICAYMAKVLGARIVWIDSITNVKKLSLSGRLVRWIADLFIVQWPELAQKYKFKNIEYYGTII